ncbi:hypothetical protein, partial [Streptomyces sp. H27-H5]|uniref:hypothetical protein n=1 Tax=Streptomyces sp. H27-H5 TaxID=2996460 RepID=UPI00226D41C5
MAYEQLSEMQVGGVWTSMVDDMRAGAPVVITRGRQDESSQVTPAKVRLRLDNRANKYSPRNARSINYGLIGRNTPVRFSVPGSYSYLDVPAV